MKKLNRVFSHLLFWLLYYKECRFNILDNFAEKVAITAFRNNDKYILNSLKYRHISNGPTEGLNNKIKVLKRVS